MRIQRSRSRVGSCVPTSKNHFAAWPKSLIWSIVWPAPFSRSSGGRSALRISSGTPASCASITAGSSSAAAVPEVHVTATGRPDALASPSAKKPRAALVDVRVAAQARLAREASTSGVQREPGEVQASRSPQRASSSTNARSSR